ncbi:MAG: flavodoxin family protein [Candidatus Thorarchaeota archaeon]
MVQFLILFHSQEYGNTQAMAEAIAIGAKAGGANVTLINTNNQRMEIEEYRKFDAVAFGSPDYYSYIAGGLKVFVDDLYIEKKRNRTGLENKPYGLFYSHGGGGRVRDSFEKLFSVMKIGTKIGKTIESYGYPSKSVIEACHELGKQLVEIVKKQ